MIRFNILVLFLVSICYGVCKSEYKSSKNYKIYEVTGARENIEMLSDFLKQLDGHFIETRVDFQTSQILIAQELKENLENFIHKQKLNKKVITNDYLELFRKAKAKPGEDFSWHAYHDIDAINGYLKNMSEKYPEMAELVEGGDSYEGRKLLGLRINNPKGSKGKHAIIIESGIHASEVIGPASATYFINQLLTSSDPDIISLRDTLDWHIFPSINPDGYHYIFTCECPWRKSRSVNEGSECIGTDPNRNWDYQWMVGNTSNDSCDDRYAGSKPFSEIETRSFAEYIKKVENLSGYVDFHSYGQYVLLPYSDSKEHRDNYDDMVKIGNSSLSYARKINKTNYTGPVTIAEILYPVGGASADWVKHTLGTDIVIIYELCREEYWPPERIPEVGEEVTQLLLGLVVGAREMGYLK